MSAEERRAPVRWYRSPVPQDELKSLFQRNDWQAAFQTLGYLGLLAFTGGATIYSSTHWPWYATLAILFTHGTFFAFQINAVHELGHNTVFRSRAVNQFFMRVFSFLGWINPDLFFASHQRHHHSTLHPPDDLEVVLPMDVSFRGWFKWIIVNLKGPYYSAMSHLKIARGKFEGDWTLFLFPPDEPEKRIPARRWAAAVLAGHALILVVSVLTRQWMVPLVVTFAPFYGSWLHVLCNETQHIGMQDNVTDFRLCCRTFEPNALVRFLYWHMNYHTEHHMYVGVPCYKLRRLHKLIEHDLPPTPKGILSTWRLIRSILAQQRADPEFQYIPQLPSVLHAGESTAGL